MAYSDTPPRSLRLTALIALLVAGCPGVAKYSAYAAYHPVSSSWDSVEIRVRGSRLPGHDLGDECEGTITVTTKGIPRALDVKYAALRATVTATAPKGLVMVGSTLDSGSLLAVGSAITAAEAEDILRAFDGACLGPKMGFPPTPALRKLIENSSYD